VTKKPVVQPAQKNLSKNGSRLNNVVIGINHVQSSGTSN